MTLQALDDHPMNWAMGLLIVVGSGLAVLSFLVYALAYVDTKVRLTEPAVVVAFIWIMLVIFYLGSTR